MVQRKAYSLGISANKTPAPAPGPAYNKPVIQNIKGGRVAWVSSPKNPNSNLPVLKHPISQINTPYGNVNLNNNGVSVNPNWGNIKDSVVKRLPPAAQVAFEIHKNLPPKYQLGNAVSVFKGVKQLGSSSPSDGDSVMNSSYGLSKAPNPKPVFLNSNIMPNAYSNDYMRAKLNLCIPMHVSNVYLGIPSSASNVLNTYFVNNLAFDIQTRAQANVGFNLNISTNLTSTQLLTAFNAGIRALQVYFYYSSILSYESNPKNKNDGMINLRSIMTPQLISDLTQLGRRLEDTPMPPRVVEWVRYMNMNFLSGDTQGAPLLKLGICPEAMGTSPDLTIPAACLTALVSDANNTVFTLLRRAIPQWRIGTLYDVPTVPVFDKNFLTIFANMGCTFKNASAVQTYFPTVTNTSDSISYNSYNNRLDGAAYAMCSAYRSSAWSPGLATPYATTPANNNTRQSYCDLIGAGATWANTADWVYTIQSRQESYQLNIPNTGSVITAHLPGADKAQGVSIDSLTQTAQNFLDFIFNVDSIPVKGKLSNFNNNGLNKV